MRTKLTFSFFIYLLITSCSKKEVSPSSLENTQHVPIIHKLVYPEGYVEYVYNSDGSLQKIQTNQNGNIVVDRTYTWINNTLAIKFFDINGNERLSNRVDYTYNSTKQVIKVEEYGYTPHKITSITYDASGKVTGTLTGPDAYGRTSGYDYAFDTKGNLMKETYFYLMQKTPTTNEKYKISESRYEYDNKNNPYLQMHPKRDPTNLAYYHSPNNIVKVTYIQSNTPDQITQFIYDYNSKDYPVKLTMYNSKNEVGEVCEITYK